MDYDFLYHQMNDEMNLLFIAEDEPVASCEIDREFYDMIMKDYIARMPDIRKDEIIINWDWALSFLKDEGDE